MPSIPLLSGVYQILCVPTGKVYIGSSGDIYQRWQTHRSLLQRGIHHSSRLQRAWNKYGPDAFVWSVLERTTPERAVEREQYYLDYLQSFDRRKGYNIRSEAASKGVRRVVVVQLRMLHQSTGRKTGRKPEHTERLRRAWQGRKHRPESIEKMRAAKAGKPIHPNATAGVVEAVSKWFVVTDPDGVEYVVRNLRAFCRERGLNAKIMYNCARGVTKQHRGWTCRYL